MPKKDDIKATSRKLQDEIQEAVHCLYQSLVAILERANHASCGKGYYVVLLIYFEVFLHCKVMSLVIHCAFSSRQLMNVSWLIVCRALGTYSNYVWYTVINIFS